MKIVLLALFFIACNDSSDQVARENAELARWVRLPCNPEQFEQVMIQSEFCREHTGYFSEACFGFAKHAICDTQKGSHP